MASGDTKTESYLRAAAEGTRADLPTDNCCNTKTQNLILGVANRIMDVEDEVEELKNNPDVVDIVDTYADLQSYDTSTLTDKDIIRVLEDSTHDNKSTYYRWNASTNQFEYIGEAGGGVNVVQTTGSSTTDVMSQDATTKMIYPDIANYPTRIKIGSGSITAGGVAINGDLGSTSSIAISGDVAGRAVVGSSGQRAMYSIAIGSSASAGRGDHSIAIGYNSYTNSGSNIGDNIAIGHNAHAGNFGEHSSSIALGAFAKTTRGGEVNIGAGTNGTGYNNTNYRVLGGVHDPVDAHDAATKGYVDAHGGGTFTPLTTSDYDWNYNTGTAENPNSIGMFLLEDGVYKIQQASPDETIYCCYNPFGGAVGAQDDYFMVQTQSYSSGGPQGAYKVRTVTDIRGYVIQQYTFYYNWNFQNSWEHSTTISYVSGDNLESRLNSLTIMPITQTDYDNLGYVDPNTLYIITGA